MLKKLLSKLSRKHKKTANKGAYQVIPILETLKADRSTIIVSSLLWDYIDIIAFDHDLKPTHDGYLCFDSPTSQQQPSQHATNRRFTNEDKTTASIKIEMHEPVYIFGNDGTLLISTQKPGLNRKIKIQRAGNETVSLKDAYKVVEHPSETSKERVEANVTEGTYGNDDSTEGSITDEFSRIVEYVETEYENTYLEWPDQPNETGITEVVSSIATPDGMRSFLGVISFSVKIKKKPEGFCCEMMVGSGPVAMTDKITVRSFEDIKDTIPDKWKHLIVTLIVVQMKNQNP